MANAVAEYMRGINRTFRYIPTWTPGRNRRLGDVGYFDRGVFERVTTLDDLGIGFDIREDTTPLDYVTQSSSGVKIDYSIAGESAEGFQAITKAEAGARIEFSRKNAFVFSAPKCHEHEIENKAEVKREVVRRLEEGDLEWEDNYTVITDLVEAPSATIIISDTSESAIELRAKGDVGLQWFSLAGLSANAEEAYFSGSMTRAIAKGGLTPLFQPLRLNKSLLERILGLWRHERPREVRERPGPELLERAAEEEESEVLLETTYDEEVLDALFEEVDIEEVLGSP